MSRRVLVTAFFCLASTAHAKCVNIPLCFAPFVPPAEALIIYENGVAHTEWGAKCLPGIPDCTGRPFWAPFGGLRTTAWYCTGDDVAKLSFAVIQNGVVGKQSSLQSDPAATGPCWTAATAPGATPYTAGALQSPSEKLVNLGAICLGDPACAQLVLDTCLSSATCKPMLSQKLNSDFNLDGRVDQQDAGWWQVTIDGLIK